MTPTCLACAKPVHDGSYTCQACTQPAARALATIADLAAYVGDTIARQNRHGTAGGHHNANNELPYNPKAREQATTIERVIVHWARHCATTRGQRITHQARPTHGPLCRHGYDCPHASCHHIRHRVVEPALARAARYLATQVPWLRYRPESAAAFDQIHQALRDLRWLLDGPTPRWYAGPCNSDTSRNQPCTCDCHGGSLDRTCTILGGCGSEGCDGHGTITTPAGQCGTDLYARPGATTITCPTCRYVYDATERRDWLLTAANDHLAHAELIGRAIAALGLECTPATVHGMARHGRLIAHGRDTAGRDTYRLGDVLDLLEERDRMKAERDARARAKAARRAAKEADTAAELDALSEPA